MHTLVQQSMGLHIRPMSDLARYCTYDDEGNLQPRACVLLLPDQFYVVFYANLDQSVRFIVVINFYVSKRV